MATTKINVSLTVTIQLHESIYVGPDSRVTRHWFSATLFGRDLGLGAETDSYDTPVAAQKAAKRAVRHWATRSRELAR